MLLESRTQYLILHDCPGKKQARTVGLAETLPLAVANWTSGSRLSPIWLIEGFDGSVDAFAGSQSLLFVGPIQPAELFVTVPGLADERDAGIWLTAGCFNVVMRLPKSKDTLCRSVIEWACSQNIACELWSLTDGEIGSTEQWTHQNGDGQPEIDNLATLFSRCDGPVLRPTFQENIIVTATSLARASAVYPPFFQKLNAVAKAVGAIAEEYGANKLGVLEMQSRLLGMNAALSRFSSQAFSGVPPILGTECHFWIHSLLGTGSANIALANLVDTIQQVLGEARIPERLEALAKKTGKVPNKRSLVSDKDLLKFDIIDATEDDAISGDPIVPLVTYFSGRDGFSSQLQTLSAPLTTLAECNSFRSNLLTVTHEITHIFVQSALAVLSPSLGDEAEMEIARNIAKPGFSASNHLDAARQLLIEAVITMEMAKTEFPAAQVEKRLPELFERWRHEVQEILVHTFDFMYFHQGDPAFYVNNIWHSWCAIPGISDRVPEYLMRTLCAIAAQLLTTSSATLFKAALKNVKDLLSCVKSNIDAKSNYVEQAINWMARLEVDPQLYAQVEKDFSARIYLVRLVRIYLFSERLAAKLFVDSFVRGGKAVTKKEKLTYTTAPLGNALVFLKNHLKENPSEAESLWVLHCLAFDVKTAPKVIT
ncbi:hypothetical protein [Magnetospirillum sp. 15-1]|uniref:hypothetical protein n=1 Tax=Magnetospirillum sp. 15-1 TaxID=1979370 RepID=UPI001144A41E|nr:hypothetical protein [Magnetospirillum sp. 15-1]